MSESSGQVAYEEWVAACGATGIGTVFPEWDKLLADEQYQWQRVANAVEAWVRAEEHTP